MHECVVEAHEGAQALPAAQRHHAEQDAQQGTEQDGPEGDEQGGRQAVGDHLPAILHDEVLPEGVHYLHVQGLFLRLGGLDVLDEVGGVYVIIRISEGDLLLALFRDEDGAADHVGLAHLQAHDLGGKLEKVYLDGALQVGGEAPGQLDLKAVPGPSGEEGDGRDGLAVGVAERLAGRVGLHLREVLGAQLLRLEPVFQHLVQRAGFLEFVKELVERFDQRRIFFPECESGREGLFLLECPLESRLLQACLREDHLVHEDGVDLAGLDGLRAVGDGAEQGEFDVFAGAELDVVAGARERSDPVAGDVGFAMDGYFFLLAGACGERQGGQDQEVFQLGHRSSQFQAKIAK